MVAPSCRSSPLDLTRQRGWQLHQVYSDRASGARERRPGLDSLMADARRGLFDLVVVWRFDRFAPLRPNPMFTIIAAMAELERNIIRERVIAGLDYARRHGTKSGKAVGRPRVIFRRDHILELRAAGLSWRQVATKLGTTVATVRRAVAMAGQNFTFEIETA